MMTTAKKSRMWKDGARRGIVYVEEREAAEKVMALQSGWAAAAAPTTTGRAPQRQRSTASLAGASSEAGGGNGMPVSLAEAELKGCAAMAVYLDRKGKPFAWQIPFPMEHWDRVTRLVGAEAATA